MDNNVEAPTVEELAEQLAEIRCALRLYFGHSDPQVRHSARQLLIFESTNDELGASHDRT